MENLTYESWVLIGLALTLFLTSVAMSIHIMKKYPPEHIPTDGNSEEDVILGPVDDDDD